VATSAAAVAIGVKAPASSFVMLCGGNITTSGSPWAPAGAAVLMQVATCSKGIGGGTPRMRGSRQLGTRLDP
jgi:hypothetical protein